MRHSPPICVYCGERPGSTRDHVPPRGLFPNPRPGDLVTVPCCEQCREPQTLDDEYFIRMVAMRHDVGDHPAAAKILESVHRSFTKPAKRGFNQALVRSVRYKDLHTPTGLYLGRAATYDVALDRLCNVIRRTTLGLFAEIFGHRLPDDYRCAVYAIDGFSTAKGEEAENLKQLVNHALAGEARVWGHKVFTSWFQRVSGRPFSTLWAHLVYSRVAFIAMTMPASDIESMQPSK